MPFDTADREAHVAIARRRLATVLARGAGYPAGHEPRIWLEAKFRAESQLLTAERLLRRSLHA